MGNITTEATRLCRSHLCALGHYTVAVGRQQIGEVGETDPELAGTKPPSKIGGTLTLYLETDAIEDVLRAVENAKCRITMPIKTQFYGMREFGFQDPNGWTITVAQRVT